MNPHPTAQPPLEQLEALAEALLDFIGPADLAAWLAARRLSAEVSQGCSSFGISMRMTFLAPAAQVISSGTIPIWKQQPDDNRCPLAAVEALSLLGLCDTCAWPLWYG